MEQKESLTRHAKGIRRHIIHMLGEAKSGHPGGSLSVVEILTVLYFAVMNVDFQNLQWGERDYLALSKGHAAPALYAVLAEGGALPVAELASLRQLGSRLQGHPSSHCLPGVDISTGSLGQGFAVAGGLAMSLKLQKKPNRVYAILGDGELDEGLIWEAAMSAAHYRLDNLIAVVDYNGLQIDGLNDEVMSLGDIGAKFAAFGFAVFQVDGHDIDVLLDVFGEAQQVRGRPAVIIAKTVKGKGISFMENQATWHGRPLSEADYLAAVAELEV